MQFHIFGTAPGAKWQENKRKKRKILHSLDPRDPFPGSSREREWVLAQCSRSTTATTTAAVQLCNWGWTEGRAKRGKGCPSIPRAHSKSFFSVFWLERKNFSWSFFALGVHGASVLHKFKTGRLR